MALYRFGKTKRGLRIALPAAAAPEAAVKKPRQKEQVTS
jgi:hypothetical protein